MNSIYGIMPEKLGTFLNASFPAYRSRQLLKWIYQRHIHDIAKMTDLPADFKEYVLQSFDLSMPQIDKEQTSHDGTRKFRLKMRDDALIEMVLMPEEKKQTLCVSSQVGCSRGCLFCATGGMGLKRNLDTHEIVQQILLAGGQAQPERITNLVFMGMGEPLDNLQNVMDAITLIQHDQTIAFSPRRTTISTCGIVPGIIKLADSGLRTKLAISLNSAIDAVRDQIMPINLKYPLAQLKNALLYYQKKSPFRITIEYIMIPGVNMSLTDIKALRRFAGDLSCKINLIPYNPVPKLTFEAPSKEQIETFMSAAMSIPQAITLRKSKGADIMGACGQLALANPSKNGDSHE